MLYALPDELKHTSLLAHLARLLLSGRSSGVYKGRRVREGIPSPITAVNASKEKR